MSNSDKIIELSKYESFMEEPKNLKNLYILALIRRQKVW